MLPVCFYTKMKIKTIIALLVVSVSLSGFAQDTQQERSDFNEVRKDGSFEAYDRFLQRWPHGYYSEQARLNRDDAIVRAYCRPDVTLDLLVDYIEINQPHAPRIRTFYANLVNQPTHSYRMTSNDLGFNGTTGTVYETVTRDDGRSVVSKYVFDDCGLLVADSVASFDALPVTHTYRYNYDNLHGFSLAACVSPGDSIVYTATYDDMDRVVALTSSERAYRFAYNDLGALASMRTRAKGEAAVFTFANGAPIYCDLNDGRGELRVRYTHDFNSDTGKRYLNGVKTLDKQGETVSSRNIAYTLDAAGRYSTASITEDDRTVLTVTRRYSN